MAKTKIGLIQVIQREEDDYNARCDMLISQAEKCFLEGAELVFFPEAFQHVPDRSIVKDHDRLLAVSAGWKQRCAALAKKYHAYLVPWDYEYTDGKVYNSSYILDREGEERNAIEKQALNALVYVADIVLFVIDASENCGYSIEAQFKLREEIEEITSVPMVTVVNKADVKKYDGFFNMSTVSGEGVEEVLNELLRIRKENMIKEVVDIRSELPVPEMRRHGGRTKSKKDAY
jgi:hypothetical protein